MTENRMAAQKQKMRGSKSKAKEKRAEGVDNVSRVSGSAFQGSGAGRTGFQWWDPKEWITNLLREFMKQGPSRPQSCPFWEAPRMGKQDLKHRRFTENKGQDSKHTFSSTVNKSREHPLQSKHQASCCARAGRFGKRRAVSQCAEANAQAARGAKGSLWKFSNQPSLAWNVMSFAFSFFCFVWVFFVLFLQRAFSLTVLVF